MRIAVVIPGIMGSSLYYPALDGTREYIWTDRIRDNYTELIHNPPVLAWSGRVATGDLIEAFRATHFDFPKRNIWKRVLDSLAGHTEFGAPHCVQRIGFDWRQSLVDSGPALVAQIDDHLTRHFPLQRPADIRLTFITHSMGGLLLRSAIGSGALRSDRIDRVVHIGAPLEGAAEAFHAAYKGCRLPYLRGVSRLRHWRNSQRFWDLLKAAIQTFPSVYQLMPFPGTRLCRIAREATSIPWIPV
jgi:hypothetical protein